MDETTLIKEMLPEVFMQRKDVINLIPDVKPNNTISLFTEIIESNMWRAIHAEAPSLHNFPNINPAFDLSNDEIDCSEIRYTSGYSERIVITTIGAKLLVRLFKAGLIEQKKKSSSKNLSELEAYSNSLLELKEQSDLVKNKQDRERAKKLDVMEMHENRIKHLIKYPEDARIEELNWTFLNSYAFAIGPWDQSFQFAGADVKKHVQIMKSNSGKSSTTNVYIQWTMPDGTRHGDIDIDPVLNRRNDPKRNFGLGRD